MKKVVSAAIYQIIQFDDEQEFENYILKLQQNHQEFILESKTKYPDDKVEIKIMKQYNNNKFIERGDKCEINLNLLNSKMALYGDNNEALAKALNLSPQRLSAKKNNTNGAEFTQTEIQIIKERYNLTDTEVVEIFLF